ncbi:MAG: hypothetical protein RI900_2613 [Actinomycetota bacterium]
MTLVAELVVQSAVEPWQRLGLEVHDNVAVIGGIALRFVPGNGGVVAWGLTDMVPVPSEIDGLPTHAAEPPVAPGPDHALGISGWDHLVVMTSSLERTCGAIDVATGASLKRIREAGPVRQGFHRMGELVIEVVETTQVTSPTASFWGFVWNVHDLDAVCARLGPELVTPPKNAVQPGRRIATVRTAAGVGVPLALMTPR